MLGTPELIRHWLQNVQEAVEFREGLPARVSDVERVAIRMSTNPGHSAIYRRLEKLVDRGFLEKRAQQGYCNSYKLTQKGFDRIA